MAQVRSPGGGIQRVPISDCAVTDLKLKERALDRTAVTGQQLGRYQPSDTVLDFLDSLTAPGPK